MGRFCEVLYALLAAAITLGSAGCGENAVCGDGKIGGSEVCDGVVLGGETCFTLTGHQQGELVCTDECMDFDTSDCHTCGDNTVEGPEVCDDQELDGESCGSLTGHIHGESACDADCLGFDVSGCHTCGNSTIEDAEACDTTELAGESCGSLAGHLHGEVACAADCLGFDTSDCHTCGNSGIEGPEQCDLGRLDGQDCKSLLFDGGELLCGQDCRFDTSGCYDCGGVDPCESVDCSSHGVCRVTTCAAYCECDTGYRPGPDLTCVGDAQCSHDRECPPDQVCSASACVAGPACNQDYNCNMETEYCHPDGKVCKLRSALCEPCLEDYECPEPSMGDMCISYPDGDFCGQGCGVTACPPGYDCDLTSGSGTGSNPGQCRSNTGSCEEVYVCQGPQDCAANQVCDTQTGQCVSMCADDTQCPGGQKCHLSGHCGPPCAEDSDCTQYGSDLICCIAPSTPSQFCGVTQAGLCRPDGCALHSECLQTQGDSLGYCDDRTHTCMPGCRAADPTSVNDCVSGMKCECTNGAVSCDGFDCCPDPGEAGACICDPQQQDCSQVTACDNGACLPIPCQERGDVNIACARNQVCCGWPLADGYPCPSGTSEGECYTAPGDIWCSPCVNDGGPCEVAGYGHGDTGACLQNSNGSSTCHLSCRDNQDCPATWQCDYSFLQACAQSTDCEPTATCDVVYRGYDGQGNVIEARGCLCQTAADCPADLNGFAPHCAAEHLCDFTMDPPDCRQDTICKFAKVCQCMACCEDL